MGRQPEGMQCRRSECRLLMQCVWQSWGYIGGTGGKCHDSGKSQAYGDEYGEGDIIGIYIDYGEPLDRVRV